MDGAAHAARLLIASIKAVAVLMYFMHLCEERFSFRFVMLVSSMLVIVLIVLTLLDPLTRGPYPPGPSHNPSFRSASSVGGQSDARATSTLQCACWQTCLAVLPKSGRLTSNDRFTERVNARASAPKNSPATRAETESYRRCARAGPSVERNSTAPAR